MEENALKIEIHNNKQKDKKNKLLYITFTRSCCTIGIIIFHYFSHSNSNIKFLYLTKNSSWGFLFSTTFFCISGTVIYYNYPKISSIKKFYYKRWKSIFPSYYIGFSFFYLNRAFTLHKLLFRGHWIKFIFTIIGLDGYLSYRIKTYFILGEWFLGAIIIIYLLYPLLLWLIFKNITLFYLILIFGYYLMLRTNLFFAPNDINIITCITSFYFGIITIKYKKIFMDKYITLIISFSLFILLNIIKLRHGFLFGQIQGFSLFLLMNKLGSYFTTTKIMNIFNFISNLSYSIFLYHHHIIYDILGIYNPKESYINIILLGITILLTLICSYIHSMVVNSVINSSIFKRFDLHFLK